MHIALLTDGVWPFMLGGMQKHSHYLATWLSRYGCRVTVYHPHTGQSSVFPGGDDGNIDSVALPWPDKGRWPGHYLRESRAWSRRIFDHLHTRLESFDLIYAQGFCAWELLTRKQALPHCPPVIVNFHGLEMFQFASSWKEKLIQQGFRGPVRENLRLADYVVALGKGLDDILIHERVPAEKILILPIGIGKEWCVADVNPVHSPVRFVFVGREEARKGLHILSRAALSVKQPYTLDLIGPRPDKLRFPGETFRFHGMIREEERIREIMRSCDAVLLPSLSEGMPTVLLEGMASGLAVVATDVGAVPQLVSGNGILVEKGSQDAFRRGMEEMILSPPESWLSMKRHSLQMIRERYTWDRIAEETLQEFGKIIARTRA